LRAHELAQPSRPGHRIDRPALPRQAADATAQPRRGREFGGRERSDDVTAAADPDAQDAGGAREPVGDGGRKL